MGSNTPNLNLYEPSVGETGWGTLVNGNFTTLDNALVNPTPSVSGTLTASGLVDISGAAAGQVKFPATQHASANANTLDDYQEGTWTPAVGGTASYALQLGTYTKVGRLATITCNLQINTLGTGSLSTISGVPAIVTPTLSVTGAVRWSLTAASYVTLVAHLDVSGTITFFGATAAAATLSQQNLFTNSTTVFFTITYSV